MADDYEYAYVLYRGSRAGIVLVWGMLAALGLLILAVGASHRAGFGIAVGSSLLVVGLLGLWFVGTRFATRIEVRRHDEQRLGLAWSCALRAGQVPLTSVVRIDGVMGGYLQRFRLDHGRFFVRVRPGLAVFIQRLQSDNPAVGFTPSRWLSYAEDVTGIDSGYLERNGGSDG